MAKTQLPAVAQSGTLTKHADTSLVPALIADAGEPAAWRYVEFFTANIRNPNTRRAYARACTSFFAWGDERGRTLTRIRPHWMTARSASAGRITGTTIARRR